MKEIRQGVSELRDRQNQRNEEHRRNHGEKNESPEHHSIFTWFGIRDHCSGNDRSGVDKMKHDHGRAVKRITLHWGVFSSSFHNDEISYISTEAR